MSEERTVYRCLHEAAGQNQCPASGMAIDGFYCRYACYVCKDEVVVDKKFKCPRTSTEQTN
jgi:hypothetical protein